MKTLEQLAIFGGPAVRKRNWPAWPKATPEIEKELIGALHSGRWAISGPYVGSVCYERQFSQAFADFMGSKFCIPTTSGTNALLLALLALGIGEGDEVLVPGLTWVACASVVTRLGATPILVDIDAKTLTMSLEKARAAITPQTKAIMLVHLYGSVGDLDGFLELSENTKIPLIEDCAQAHGTKWKGKCVGTWGKVGCFSMQQSKLLTSGEGGAVITDDPQLASLIEQLRSDGRLFSSQPEVGKLELIEKGEIQGYNMCLSEFQSAVLLGGLKTFDQENKLRKERASYLARLLKEIDVEPLDFDEKVTFPTYYNYAIKLNLGDFANNSIDAITRALSKELNANINPIYRPLNQHPLYCPLRSRDAKSLKKIQALDPKRFSLPNSEAARACYITLHHSLLLDTHQGMEEIAYAIKKVRAHSHTLLNATQESSNIAF